MTEKSLLHSIAHEYAGLSADQVKDMLDSGMDPKDAAQRESYRKMHEFVNPVLPDTNTQYHKHIQGPLKYVPKEEEK